MAVSDWSTVPGNNSAINGINIAEGCSPAGINNAIREVMAQARAKFDSVDGASFSVSADYTVSGDWTVSGAWTFGGGSTFNGVMNAQTINAQTINATVVAVSSTGPNFRATDTDTGNMVYYGANNSQGVWNVDPSDTVASSSALIRVDGATGAVFQPGVLRVMGAIEADTLGAKVQAAVDARVASISPVKAWVNFRGTGTVAIRKSFNVSSITDNGTGDYTVNFATALQDANYSVIGMPNSFGNFETAHTIAIKTSSLTASPTLMNNTKVRLNTGFGGALRDGSTNCVAVLR